MKRTSLDSEVLDHHYINHLTLCFLSSATCFYELQINAEFQRITTHPLETTFMAQLDSLQPQLSSVFQKKGGVTGQKLAKHLQILLEVTMFI